MFRAHAAAGHTSHLPLGSARAPEAQNNADSDTNELAVFSAGKRAEEKGGPGRLRGPRSCAEDFSCCAHVQDKVEGGCMLFLGICIPGSLAPVTEPAGACLELLQPCMVASVPMAILGLLERQTQGYLPQFHDLHLASGALWLGAAIEMAQTHQELASAVSLRLGGDDAVSGTQFIEGSSVHTEQKC